MSGELVPFGKHKGEPVEQLLADQGYMEWLLAQPWVRDRYPTFHQTIINYGGEPSESPEHNQMQAAFLDDERCLALARLLYPPGVFDGDDAARIALRHQDWYRRFKEQLKPRGVKPRVLDRRFENGGWDVTFTVAPAAISLDLMSFPVCSCLCDHDRDCAPAAVCHGGKERYACRHDHCSSRVLPVRDGGSYLFSRRDYHSYDHCDTNCPWRDEKAIRWLLDEDERVYQPSGRQLHVECKPDLGDDFPAVLRQVLRYDGGDHLDRRVVVARRHGFEHVTWEQAQAMFGSSGIALVAEGLLEEPA
jgi:hypothetical protein